jgi:hypothetical protein
MNRQKFAGLLRYMLSEVPYVLSIVGGGHSGSKHSEESGRRIQ